MTPRPISRPTSVIERLQARERAQAARPPADPTAVFHWLCNRCGIVIWAHGIAYECARCIDHAVRAFGSGPLSGEVGGE